MDLGKLWEVLEDRRAWRAAAGEVIKSSLQRVAAEQQHLFSAKVNIMPSHGFKTLGLRSFVTAADG